MEGYDDALRRMARWCSDRERAPAEVWLKLKDFDLDEEQRSAIFSKLSGEGFINEERFALAYAGGKFRINKWGRMMIRQSLISKGISRQNIEIALLSIPDEDWATTLDKLLSSKSRSQGNLGPAERHQRLLRFAYSKGYSQEETWRSIERLGL